MAPADHGLAKSFEHEKHHDSMAPAYESVVWLGISGGTDFLENADGDDRADDSDITDITKYWGYEQ